MIEKTLMYQGALFVNASDIIPNARNITNLINEFSDYGLIPNTFQEISVLGPQARIVLNSSNGEWTIQFGTSRIDIKKNATDSKGSNLGDLEQFCQEVNSISERIYKKYPKKANRLALITRFLLKEMGEEKLQAIFSKLNTPMPFYIKNPIFEWNNRMVAKIEKEISGENEAMYFNTSINRIRGSLKEKMEEISIDRIELKFDLNTAPSNVDYRFDLYKSKEFFTSASGWHNELLNEAIEYIK